MYSVRKCILGHYPRVLSNSLLSTFILSRYIDRVIPALPCTLFFNSLRCLRSALLPKTNLRLGARAPGLLDGLELGGPDAGDAALLVLAEPGLLAVAEEGAAEEVRGEADDDADEGDGVEVVDGEVEDAGADDDAPEVGREEGDVVEAGGAHAQHDGDEGVEDAQAEGVADEVAGHVAVPDGAGKGVAVEDGAGDAVDDDAEDADEGEDVVDGGAADEPLLEDVAEAVAGRRWSR